MLWACVLLPRLALDAALRRRPDPAAPFVLVGGPAQRRVVHAANAAARQHGLRRGQPFAAAQALLPDVPHAEYDTRVEQRWQRFLAAWAYRYSGQVSTAWPDAVLLEAGASFGLFGPWPRFAGQLREDLSALGFTHRLALAPTPRAAYVLAGAQDGLAIATPHTLRRALAALPVQAARFAPADVEALQGMGLRTLGQLFEAPKAGLARRFGPALLEQLDRMLGHQPEPLPLYAPEDRFDERIELAYETASSEALLFPLRRLTGDLAAYLAGRDGGVQQFVLLLEHDRQPPSRVAVSMLAAERDAALLFELARSRLEQARLPAPVCGVRLLAEQLPPFVPAARGLFDVRTGQGEAWGALRERLRARLGVEAVFTVVPQDDHRPERTARHAEQPGATRPIDAAAPAAPRPTWLLPRPIPLRTAPARILAGPERLETGWWDGEDIRRDYYVVETTQGQRAWVFCAPGERGPFMLHGWFA